MFASRQASCPFCKKPARFKFSLCAVRIAIPVIFYQEQPYGQKPIEVGRIADSSYSDQRNLDIPPDYPNLLEV